KKKRPGAERGGRAAKPAHPGRSHWSIHTFEPSPADSVALAQAILLFANGLGLETWLDKLYAASGSRAQRVVVTTGLELLPVGEEAPSTAREPREFDPHVWHDVQNAIRMVENIRKALAQADPGHARTYQVNAERYTEKLRELDAWIHTQVRTLPPSRRKLVTTHDAFRYFARRYGFTVIGTIFGPSTDVAEPSARRLAELVETIRRHDIPALFTETMLKPSLARQIAREAGIRLAPPLYSGSLGAPGSPADTYIKMMRYNVLTIIEALHP
ncbi:MAG: hypothetical protein D6736_21680, partial [Nitrospinota bacterium]